ncbi:MAG: hypothetical protein OXG97_22120, partial [Candidatus Poribacteria bacterium]|nr:hypothetical protein [Candidatus Poribacteria bacterium]
LKNQNQRYEVRMDFPGYEVRMDFPGYEVSHVGFPAPYQGDFKRKCVSPTYIIANKYLLASVTEIVYHIRVKI